LDCGGTPYRHRRSSDFLAQSDMLNGGFAITKSACRSGSLSSAKVSAHLSPTPLGSIPWMARFIFASRQVRSFASWP
jgi:hypothetical protein